MGGRPVVGSEPGPDELQALTGYKQPAAQLAELQRQGYWRARRAKEARQQRAAGLVRFTQWIHPDDAAALREHAAKLARKREKQQKEPK